MSIVIEVLNRSLINLKAEYENIEDKIGELDEEILEYKNDLSILQNKIEDLINAIDLLESGKKDVTTNSKNKKNKP